VGALAKVVAYLGGDATFESKAFVVLVTLVVLAIAAQSDRVRLHVGRFMSRYFQRPTHDYRTIWRKFTEGTSSRVEQFDLCRALVKLVGETFQALSVGIWLVDDKSEALTLAASTSLPEAAGRELAPTREETRGLVQHFQAKSEPVDIEPNDKAWALALKNMHPSDFANGGHRVCLPLLERGNVMGLMTIGDRVGGIPFSTQDFEILKCIGDHITGSLLNARYSRTLLQAKEFEAFQTMAAFFVHDLKNAASTLNLMLQNLPVHYDDPAFREDALRGVGKTVDHINHLVSRLSLLRHELKMEPNESDLNDLVAASIEALAASPSTTITTEFSPLPRIAIDRQQMSKVITNLALNAIEASSHGGQVLITTRQEPGWVVVSVVDKGCGMSAEFIRNSLFRPFKTTKKNGLGIGMFQSKMIVEAHGGKIAFESVPGHGTDFRVFLPAPTSPT
jgi:putative PEP-CTERM system histidine kinase